MTAPEHDPIVVSGMAIEAPGGIETPQQFWSALSQGHELIGPFPRDRDWPVEQLLSLHRLDAWSRVRDAGG
ncbi:beta-ketoacyl synthase N-terminal-like domain-containing protein, partial [Nocardia gipuzkoensis]